MVIGILLNEMKRVLLHICCADCAIYPLNKLREEKIEVTGFWYNPNIHPYTEYQKRLMTLGYYTQRASLPLIYKDEYDLEGWLKNLDVRYQMSDIRCERCYRMRLKETVKIAKENKFDSFTTTLLYSKHQKHDLIKEICQSLADKNGLEFYCRDFREGWKEGIEISKKMGLYRQNYCGCIFSEKERYANTRE